jgi:hypothetical protein
MKRFTLATGLGVVGLFAVGLAALVQATELWVGLMFLVTFAALVGSLLGVILLGRRASGWVGFAFFGWSFYLVAWFYFFVSSWPGVEPRPRVVSNALAHWVFQAANRPPETVQPPPAPPVNANTLAYFSGSFDPAIPGTPAAPPAPANMRPVQNFTFPIRMINQAGGYDVLTLTGTTEDLAAREQNATLIAHYLFILGFGALGAWLGGFLARQKARRDATPVAEIASDAPPVPVEQAV